MRTIGALPKSVLMLEIIGMVLLSLALLSLNDYLTLPAPLGSPLACVVMIFLGGASDASRRGGINVAYCSTGCAAADVTNPR